MLSIIIPVLNRENLVLRCLDSIVNQSVLPDEIIVVDNGSTDKTKENVKGWFESHKDTGIKLSLLNEEKRGATFARQKGLEKAENPYLIFFDSDDEMLPTLIEKALSKLKSQPSADIITWNCRLRLLDASEKIPTVIPGNFLESHLIHALLRPQGYLVSKSLLKEAGGWKKPLKIWNDYETGLRLLLTKPEIIYIDEVLANIYSQVDSITGTNFSSKKESLEETLDEMERETLNSNHPDRTRILKILNYRRSILAAHYKLENNYDSARTLFKKTIKGKPLKESLPLIFSYYYTGLGFRGAWRLVRYFI